ncbi:MAG: sigma 54-interacting transcriptional regulator [Polyangia bacterium]
MMQARTPALGLVCESRAMRRFVTELEHAAASEVPVLIWGEPGVGNERAARALHERSGRGTQPLEVIRCSGLDGVSQSAISDPHPAQQLVDAVVMRAALLLDQATAAEIVAFFKDQGAALAPSQVAASVERLYDFHYALRMDVDGKISCPLRLLRHFLSDISGSSARWHNEEDRLRSQLAADIASLRAGAA